MTHELLNECLMRSDEASDASQEVYDMLDTLRKESPEEYKYAVETILERLIDTGYEGEPSIYHNYSGRGMYGKKCYGLTTSEPMNIIELAGAAGLFGAKMDSLGRSTIVYWPSLRSVDA